MAQLIEWVEATPDITIPELAAKLRAERGVTAHPASLSRALLAAGFSFKKTLLASESEGAGPRDERPIWRSHRQPRMRERPHRLLFIDETATTTDLPWEISSSLK